MSRAALLHEVTKPVSIRYPAPLSSSRRPRRAIVDVRASTDTVTKLGLTRNKVMLCVWWDWKGIIHYELLPPGRTIDSELYCEQLIRLSKKLRESGR
ncbi:hypothetical protein F3H09_32330, partial [Pseudomonas aeruginosa]